MADQSTFAVESAALETDPDPMESSTLFAVIDRDKVFGLNLTVPEDAKEVIKPWNERESLDKCADSGVDDQVCRSYALTESNKITSLPSASANHTRTIHPKCEDTECFVEIRSAQLPLCRHAK